MKDMTLTGKTIMILGAAKAQIPLVEAARSLGLKTVVVSTPGDWPCFAMADEVVTADISDPEAVLGPAEKHRIDGIATCCMDIGVPALGKVCENLGLKGPGWQAARTARNKLLMKEAFQRAGLCCARHRVLSCIEDLASAAEELSFPLVLKAVDLMGSRGICLCRDLSQARKYFSTVMEQTKEDYCLAEEFLDGKLFDGEAMVQDGRLLFTMFSNSRLIRAHVPTSIGHSIPWRRQTDLGEEAAACMASACAALGLDHSAFDCDLMVKDGKVYIIELNARAGACCLPELIGRAYGINYYEVLVRLAMGQDVSAFFASRDPAASAAAMIISRRSGILRSIRTDPARMPPVLPQNRLRIDFASNPGDPVRVYTNGRDSLGEMVVSAPTLEEAERILDAALGAVDCALTTV